MSRPICPTRNDLYEQLLLLLPEGDAWLWTDGTVALENSPQKQFFYAWSLPFYALALAICGSYDEFFSSTADEDLDLWFEEYGIPDDCDPFANNLVAKVQTAGGTSIAYYKEKAAALGWDTDMYWLQDNYPAYPGIRATLLVRIKTATSDASFAVIHLVSNWVIGQNRLGAPSTAELTCALDRIIPAHNAIMSEVI